MQSTSEVFKNITKKFNSINAVSLPSYLYWGKQLAHPAVISANMNRLFVTKIPESHYSFAVVKSIASNPFVPIQILDKAIAFSNILSN